MDSLSTQHIIDIAIVATTLLLGVAGFWRGVAKEVFISAGALLGYAVAIEWSARWGGWLGGATRLTSPEGEFAASVATLALSSMLIGYVASAMAGLPPADVPGRLGGFVLGATTGVFMVAVVLRWARNLVLNVDRTETLQSTEIGRRLGEGTEWVFLGMAAVAVTLVVGSWQVRERRGPIVSVTGAPMQGDSGFRLRRESPLAPEPEKIERPSGAIGAWTIPTVYAETAPLTRVPDPSARNDRPISGTGQFDASSAPWRAGDAIRCISCGARIGDNDRFCPRCGRQLT